MRHNPHLEKLQRVAELCFLETMTDGTIPGSPLSPTIEVERQRCLQAGASEAEVAQTINTAFQTALHRRPPQTGTA